MSAITNEVANRTAPSSTGFDRQPPQDIAAEQSVLGGMLLSKDAISDVVALLRPEDHYRPAHQMIHEVIVDLFARGEPADAVTVNAELTKRGQLMRVGGAPYLHTLINLVPTAANAGFYAEIVSQNATLRRLVEAGTRIVQMGYGAASGELEEPGDIAQVVDRAQAAVYDVTERKHGEDYVVFEELVESTLDEIERSGDTGGNGGISTGFKSLDNIIYGLGPGQMVVIAARPGMGKSTLALDFIRSCSIQQGLPSVIFSLEMSKSEIAMRLFSAETSIELGSIRSGNLHDDEWAKLVRRSSELAEIPLYIDDSPNLTMMEIRAKARRLKQQADIRLIVIDYLQLMTSGKRVESRQQEVSEFSRSLKLLAKELEVPVIAISQLNRKAEDRSDGRPALSDLRESGAIEQDCDIAILIHRADAYNKESERQGEADLIVAKHRNGRTDDAVTIFQGRFSRFADAGSDDYGNNF